MGEAKRRKQLGLMPQIENHDVTLHRDGSVSDHALPGAVMQRLKTWAETGERWDARYRTSFIGTGLPRELLKTEEDLMDIPVPERMRLRLGLLSGSPAWLERELGSGALAMLRKVKAALDPKGIMNPGVLIPDA